MTKRPEFSNCVCPGDSISWTRDGFDVKARIEYDDDTSPPDKRQDGFWPSLDPEDAGYIGPYSKKTLQRHAGRAQEVMRAWKQGEWFYCGVCVTVSFDGIELTGKYDHACWGIECNYPTKRKGNPNRYLGEMAREIAEEAIEAAKAKLDRLKEKVS